MEDLTLVDHRLAKRAPRKFLKTLLSAFKALHALAEELANDEELCDEMDMTTSPPHAWLALPAKIKTQQDCDTFLSVLGKAADEFLTALDGDCYKGELFDTLAEIYGRIDMELGDETVDVAVTLEDVSSMLSDAIEEHYN